MKISELREAWFSVYYDNWKTAGTVEKCKYYGEKCESAKQLRWKSYFDAYAAALNDDDDTALVIIDDLLDNDNNDPYALLLKARVLAVVKCEYSEAVEIYNLILGNEYKKDEEDWIHSFSILFKCLAYGNSWELSEAGAACDELWLRYSDNTDLLVRDVLAKALITKGIALYYALNYEDSLAVCNDVIAKYEEIEGYRVQKQVARAYWCKSATLFKQDERELAAESLQLFEGVLHSLDKQGHPVSELYVSANKLRVSLGVSDDDSLKGPSEAALSATRSDPKANLKLYLDCVLSHFDKSKQDEYFGRMESAQQRTDKFIFDKSIFKEDASFLMVLREWNSYTPVIPAVEESDRGGGYFLRHGGEGIVVDPGYDFIENFHRAGGQLADIDHIVVTHAHDDHTAELEPLLMLLQRYNKGQMKSGNPKKEIGLYLSIGTQRKFSGLINLQEDAYEPLVTLSTPTRESSQIVQINDETKLTVLPAYHDDVITRNKSVGLAFTFKSSGGERKIIFTGDSGLFPKNKPGKKPELLTDESNALYRQYKDVSDGVDLLVAHIGSIQKSEFQGPDKMHDLGSEEWYYPNHLGLLGTFAMIDQLNPQAAIVSEFGSELRGFHIELVGRIQKALSQKRSNESPGAHVPNVIPGDLTIIYDIMDGKFLCHETLSFEEADSLEVRPSCDCNCEWNDTIGQFLIEPKGSSTGLQDKTYLVKDIPEEKKQLIAQCAVEFWKSIYNRELKGVFK